MGQRTKPRIVGASGSIFAALWAAYANWTTASQLPDDAGWVAQMLADPPVYLPWLALAIFVLVAAWAFWPRQEAERISEATTQTTHGPYSPNYAKVEGGVHNYFGPPAPPPEPQPKSQPRGYARLAAMRRCPEMPISEALSYLMAQGRSRDEARRTLQQAFRDQRMEVWGRAEIRPKHHSAPFSAQETWERIHPNYWTEFKLAEEAFEPDRDQPQTVAQDHVMKRLLRRYWSLRVSGDQLREEWALPRPPETDDDGLNWKTV